MAGPKLLVTGAQGQLGRDLVAELSRDFKVVGMNRVQMDITDCSAVAERLEETRPDVVLHAAAFADVDGCETDPDRAILTNVTGTNNVAEFCRNLGIKLFFYSTDFVFDGTNDSAYTENDKPNPINVYGRTKLEAEQIVASTTGDYVIMRVAWLYGTRSRNFVSTITKLAQQQARTKEKGEQVLPFKLVQDQIGNPTWTIDVARQTGKLIMANASGLFHAVTEGSCSRNELAEEVYSQMGWSPEYNLCSLDSFPGKAERPRNTALAITKLKGEGLSVMRHWRESLTEFLTLHGREMANAL